MRRILFTLAALVFALGANADEYVTEIEVLKGEKWWGLDCYGDSAQPFLKPFKEIRVDNIQDESFNSIMVSNTGRYIYSPADIKVSFDGNKFTICSEHEKIEVQKGGKSLREAYVVCALKNFAPGAAPDPDMFALPIYETYYELRFGQGEEEMLRYARKILEEGWPAGIIVVPDGWQKVNGPYEFDPDIYPDPKRMVDKLHELGFKVMLTVSPYTAPWGKVYGEALQKNQIDGHIRERHYHYPYCAVLDMGAKEQFERIKTGLDRIKAEYGFDGYRIDGVEKPEEDEFITNMMSLLDGINFASLRSTSLMPYAPYVTSYRYFWEYNIQTHINRVVISGMMGYPYMQTGYFLKDVGAYLTRNDQRLMADYLLLQCGMPVLSIDFAPWRINIPPYMHKFDPQVYENVKAAINFRVSIGDYVRKLVADSRRTGEPLVRHMEYQFPKSGFFDCSDQFMLGPKYLFAPCVDRADKRLVRFPKGTWIGRNGEKIKGPVVKQVDCSAGELIVFEAAR